MDVVRPVKVPAPQSSRPLEDVAQVVGYVVLLLLCWRLLKFIIKLLGFFTAKTPDLKKYGQWAIVTGCTDGIGQDYASQIAAQGMDLVLISRTLSKLQNTATELEEFYKIKTKIIAADFTRTDIYDNISKEIEGLEIGILVNNVGMALPALDAIGDVENRDEVHKNVINCNITSVTMMTSLVVNQMAERGRGLIINIASLSAAAPLPLMAVYAATKSFVNNFSLSVQAEYAGKGVEVQCILPGYVATKMPGIKRASLTVPSPKNYVRSALTTVGNSSRSSGYWVHEIMLVLFETLTYISPTFVSLLNHNYMNARRTEQLERKARKEKEQKKDS